MLDRHQRTKFNFFYLNGNKIAEIYLVNGFFSLFVYYLFVC